MPAEITTIKLKKQTKKMLEELGKKNETYDDIIKKLIEYYYKSEK
ncbi:MAG: hypothetical protein QXI58_07710 [Candidatus Micrarchaeia archaeon]